VYVIIRVVVNLLVGRFRLWAVGMESLLIYLLAATLLLVALIELELLQVLLQLRRKWLQLRLCWTSELLNDLKQLN